MDEEGFLVQTGLETSLQKLCIQSAVSKAELWLLCYKTYKHNNLLVVVVVVEYKLWKHKLIEVKFQLGMCGKPVIYFL